LPVLYVATVHFRTPRWIDVQQSYLRRNIREPFKTFAVLDGIDEEYHSRFDRIVAAEGSHEGRLNLLAAEISVVADPDDVILFLDGDAFPVADPMPTIRRALASTSLVAVRRNENQGDRQPHPSFCAVTVGEWKRLHGDWAAGYVWTSATGLSTSDVGGNLLGILERGNVRWTPLLRTNTRNDHPVWFGVYGDIVYHHGSGFRRPFARVDMGTRPSGVRGERIPIFNKIIPWLNVRRRRKWMEELQLRNERLGEEWFELLRSDPNFYLRLIEP
jgi:hypothetical protein